MADESSSVNNERGGAGRGRAEQKPISVPVLLTDQGDYLDERFNDQILHILLI